MTIQSSLRRAVVRILVPILHSRNFRFAGARFSVKEGVLNPTLFRASLVFAREARRTAGTIPADILELGCGCGLTSVVLALDGHRVTAVDLNLQAIRNTRANAQTSNATLRAVCSDWDAALESSLDFDLVVTNPPFLPSRPPMLEHALWGGANLEVVKAALVAAKRRVRPEGRILLLTSGQSGRSEVLGAIEATGLESVNNSVVRHWGERLHLDLLALSSHS
jgi:methylase of polypeptide subunit release factors